MYSYKYAYPSVVTTIGGFAPGIHLVGDYVVSQEVGREGISTCMTGAPEYPYPNDSYDINYFVIDSEGTRFPESGHYTETKFLDPGINFTSFTETATGEGYSKNVDVYWVYAFEITDSSGTAIGEVPTIAGVAKRDAEDQNITLPDYRMPTYSTVSEIVEGVNTVTMTFTDPNGHVSTTSNTIDVTYAETAPILSVDGIFYPNDISTENYEVDVEYLYGGSFVYDGGELVLDEDGNAVWEGGTVVTVTDYDLLPAENNVQITGLTDDFGQSFDTTTILVTKIPALIYTGLTIIDNETYGTTYAATDTLTVDQGAAYETTATPTEAPYTFTEGDYKEYNFTGSYTYPATTVSNSVAVDILYNEFALFPHLFTLLTDRFPVYTAERDATNQHPQGSATLRFSTAVPTLGSSIVAYNSTTTGNRFNNVEPELRAPSSTFGNLAHLSGNTFIFKPEEAWFASVFVEGSANDFVCMGRVSDDNAESTYVLHNGTSGNFDIYMGGTLQASVAAIESGIGNFIAWKNWNNGSTWVDTLQINDATIYTARSTNRGTAVANVAPTFGGGYNVETNVDPDTDAQRLSNGAISAIGIVDGDNATIAAITDSDIDAVYLRNDKQFLINLTGDSIADGSTLTDPATESFYALCRQDSIDRGHDAEWTETAIAGRHIYDGAPDTPESGYLAKPPFVSAERPDPDASQGATVIWDKVQPDGIIVSYTGGNGTANGYVVKNPTGNNSYADEDVYMGNSARAFFENRNAFYIYSTPTPREEATIVGEDNLSVQDAQKAIRDSEINNDSFPVMIDSWSDFAEPDNSFKAGLANDNVHWNTAGHEVHRPHVNTAINSIMDDALEYIPAILEIDGNDVSEGQVPKLNTAGGGTVAVKWTDNLGVEHNDTEPVIAHENATTVEINRQGTIATYSHKTGLPLPFLKSYYEDNGITEVDFSGVYTVPDTVASPVKFGWSVSNGNETGSVIQTPFTQAMTIDEQNDVITPAFTDDWGNSATLESRTTDVLYGESALPSFTYTALTLVGNETSISTDSVMAITGLTDSQVLFSRSDNLIRSYAHDGTDWAQAGNTIATPTDLTRAMTVINDSDDFAYFGSDNELETFNFDGTDFTSIGNALTISNDRGSLCRLGDNRVVASWDAGVTTRLGVYDWDGTDWSLVGSTLDTGVDGRITSVSCLTDSTFALVENNVNQLKAYSFDGSTISQVGNTFATDTLVNANLANLTQYDVALYSNNTIKVYRFDGTDFSLVSSSFSVTNAGAAKICKLDSLNIGLVTQFGAVLSKRVFTTTP